MTMGPREPELRRVQSDTDLPIPEALRGLAFVIRDRITIPPKPMRAVDRKYLDDGHQT